MARKPRVEFAGALYHVICRGNQRQAIFRSDADRMYYLEQLEQYRERYGFKVYAYVLMGNHVHLLIETAKIPLSEAPFSGSDRRNLLMAYRRFKVQPFNGSRSETNQARSKCSDRFQRYASFQS